MTNIWLLSKQSMKGMDLLEMAVDVLYSLEQKASYGPLDERNLKQSLDRGHDLLQMLASAAKTQISQKGQQDLFMLRIVENLEKKLGIPPSELSEKLERGSFELKDATVSKDTIEILEEISNVLMKLTSRSVDAISISLR